MKQMALAPRADQASSNVNPSRSTTWVFYEQLGATTSTRCERRGEQGLSGA